MSNVDHCKTRIKERESHLQALTMELTTIFNLLKQCTIDPDILRVNQERAKDPQQYSCLFDYISDQEIIELQQQADDEIGDMETANNALQNQVKWLSGFMSDITKARTKSLVIPLDEATAAYSSEKIQIQEDEISNMADILTSLTNHYDQLGEATRMYQSDPEGRHALDITVLQEDHEHIPTILEELKHSLAIVESISQEIQTRMEVYLQVKTELLKITHQLETFSTGQADIILEKLADTDMEIKERELNLDEFFKQLSALAEWYQCYASSYNYLLLEIERRKKAEERQEAQRRELTKAFEDAYHDELQERRSWSAQHGQYLPEVLCPFINDPPSMLTIQVNESSTHRLPELLPENVQKALSEIHNTH
ncbi:autophagy-related protein 17 [Gilbertella persicaria]|uniref:autophagy-related protein 17 n=1 Tax=Gilbertella persicaria TaxID=101096 RepID=UPI0022210FF6|nr:autophagy-related protein 17 [Gilbertella persicaria]KAI8068132.1 autophagy-related protein 17 [Gilbertella persicaria]